MKKKKKATPKSYELFTKIPSKFHFTGEIISISIISRNNNSISISIISRNYYVIIPNIH